MKGDECLLWLSVHYYDYDGFWEKMGLWLHKDSYVQSPLPLLSWQQEILPEISMYTSPNYFPDRPSSCLVKPRNTACMGSFLSPTKPLNALPATLPPATDPSHSFFWKWRRQRPKEESGTKGNFLEPRFPSPQLRESMGEQGKRPWEIFINFLLLFF